MAETKNTFKKVNKEKEKPKKEEKPQEKKEKKKKSSETEDLVGESKPIKFNPAVLISDKSIRIYGLLIMVFSVFLFFSCFSYLFTWKEDQSLVSGSWWSLLTNGEAKVENVLGKLGALFSNLLIYKWFGIASFMLIFLLFLVGFRILTRIKLLRFKPVLIHTFFIICWLPIFMSFIFPNPNKFYLGGAFGFFLNQWISNIIGSIGVFLLLLASMTAFLMLNYNLSFAWIMEIFNKKEKEQEPETDEIKSEENTVPPDDENNEEEMDEEEIEDVDEEDQINAETEEDGGVIVLNPVEEKPTNPSVIEDENGVTFSIVEKPETELTQPEQEQEPELVLQGDYDPTLDIPHYKMPPIDILADYEVNNSVVTQEELTANKDRIVKTLKDYGIIIDHIQATIGPTVTLYEIIPQAGTRISKIQNLERDIALSLAALGIRIIAPMPGKGTIGIEVPNSKPQVVSMKTIIQSEKFQNSKFDLPIGIGKTISNEIYIADLAKMPHLLMAGATGQGKSVGLNAILTSLLYKKHPALIKFVLVDPKKVELTLYNHIEKHFLAKLPDEEEAIITDVKKAQKTLNSLCKEMDNRYDLLKKAEVRNIKEYNAKFISRKLNPNIHRFLPYIVLVVDEFADLIMTAGREVETPIARLAQLARAIGIHLIIATQRPSVNIITGIIKANFPARIAFRVSSKIDSRTILDSGGAEQLIGRGDMLSSNGNELIRLQCPLVDTPEIAKLTEFISNQQGYTEAFLLPEVADESSEGGGKDMDPNDKDPLFDEAARLIVSNQMGSTSLIQRKMKLGYNRAGRIMDQLEAAGIVGPSGGSKAREVLVKSLEHLEQILRNNNF